MPTYLGIEGGGTTWKVAIAQEKPDNIVESIRFDTTTPDETFGKIKEWIKDKTYDSIGIATFGPLDPKLSSPTYGHITSTPKPGWKNVDVVGALTDGSKPVLFDTDVNAPALAEYTYHRPSMASSTLRAATSRPSVSLRTG
ncbi:fructokinase [Nannochloropsis gaditana]|uniref:fructokinase n=1 Tax=Nannochloropsis gaditana TaxID=72520 RepID=W7TQA6_9STRA|nr:fructokinase [Nannochloropsis gaditana]